MTINLLKKYKNRYQNFYKFFNLYDPKALQLALEILKILKNTEALGFQRKNKKFQKKIN